MLNYSLKFYPLKPGLLGEDFMEFKNAVLCRFDIALVRLQILSRFFLCCQEKCRRRCVLYLIHSGNSASISLIPHELQLRCLVIVNLWLTGTQRKQEAICLVIE